MALQQTVRENNKFTPETTVFVALAALDRSEEIRTLSIFIQNLISPLDPSLICP